jgi:pimeloyl-ACP methyl ester carboxylesterase
LALVFKDSLFQAQWLRAVGHSSAGGAEIGECLAVARQIREPDPESWYSAWSGLAERVLAQAEASQAAGRIISARDAYLRASNYFRAAYTFLIGAPISLRLLEAYRRHRMAFERAVAFMRFPAERIVIPSGDTAWHGYCFRAAEDPTPRPTLIITGGYDSTAEEAYFFSGRAAVERGYTCIVFDGPGQGAALIENRQVFRPDWEAVIRSVVDYSFTRADVDRQKIALMGISFGGYLAPRAASGDARIAACIADPGEFSLFDEFRSRLPKFIARELPDGNAIVLRLLNFLLRRRLRHPTAGWGIRRGLWTHGIDDPLNYIRLTQEYSLEGRVAMIRCPTLICSAENDEIGVTGRTLYDRLKCEKTYMRFAASDGAGEHCEIGARALFNQRAFDWMDSVLGRPTMTTA